MCRAGKHALLTKGFCLEVYMTEVTTFSDHRVKSLLHEGAIDLDKLFQWWHASETHDHVSDTTRWAWWCDYGQCDYLYDEFYLGR